jgi:putative ABC transport system permease protein
MLAYNLKCALSNTKRNLFYSILNISGFAIGFTVVLIITIFLFSELTVDHSFKDHGKIFRMVAAKKNDCNFEFERAGSVKSNFPEIEDAAPVQYLTGWSLNTGSEGEFVKLSDIIATDNSFFRIFGISLQKGFSSEPFSEKNSAVITENLAKNLFGDKDPLGRKIDIGGFIETRVTGVVENMPSNTSFSSELFINIEDESLRLMQSCDNGKCTYPANIYLKLNEPASRDLLENKINAENITEGENNLWLQSLADIYFDKGFENSMNRTANTALLLIFAGIALLILLLSVFNHVNFSISLQYYRMFETGIRKAHGASFTQLVLYHLTENTIGILISFLLSLEIASLLVPIASQLFGRDLQFAAIWKYPVNLAIPGIVISVILATTIFPLYLVSKFEFQKFLSGDLGKIRGSRISYLLTFSQIVVSVILIAGVFTINKQIFYARTSDLGFDKEHLLRLNLPGDFDGGLALKQEMAKLPFVNSLSLTQGVPGMINISLGSGETGNEFNLDCIEADIDFIETFKVGLLEGRNFLESDEGKACLINQTAFKKLGWDKIEGKTFRNSGGLEVIGVVNDFHVSSIHTLIKPAVLIFRNKYKNSLTMRVQPGNTDQQMTLIQAIWKEVMPDNSFDVVFYDAFFNALYQKEERLMQTVTIFSVLALIITLLGIAGMVFQSCIVRTKEIGIRKVNGATTFQVMLLFNKEYFLRVVPALVVAFPAAFIIMQKWLQNFAYRTDLSWWIFASAGLFALAITLITVSLQSWQTATKDPVNSLRYE